MNGDRNHDQEPDEQRMVTAITDTERCASRIKGAFSDPKLKSQPRLQLWIANSGASRELQLPEKAQTRSVLQAPIFAPSNQSAAIGPAVACCLSRSPPTQEKQENTSNNAIAQGEKK